MKRKNIFESSVTTKLNKFEFIIPILFTIIISSFLSYFVFFLEFEENNSFSLLYGLEDFFALLNIAIIILISITSLFIFFRLFRKKQKLALKILVAAFILSGILSTLLFVKLMFNSIFMESPVILIIAAFVTYIGAYFAYLVMVEALSERMKNLLFVICSGALGSFVGVLVPSMPIILVSLFLSAIDLILIKRKSVEKIFGKSEYEKLIVGIAFSNNQWGVGIGDLTCYSMVVSNTFANFGVLGGVVSLFLILFGSYLSLLMTLRRGRFPGLPITLVLGLIPLIIMSIL
jgi:hypothetical protein